MSATIIDVAHHCNVSPGIVSRVLDASRADIGEDLRRTILESAQALGCVPSAKTHRLGVLFMDESAKGLTHPFFAAVLDAFKVAAESKGYDVTFINHRIGDNVMTYLEYCQYRRLDGVCIACIDFEDPQVVELVKSGIACVTVDHIYKKIPSVLSDNETGVQKLVEHAISMGHKRIAFIHGHNNSIVTRTRIKQFHQTMQFYKLPVPEEYVRGALYGDIGLARKIVGELLRLPERPTCILLPDDLSYLGAMDAARELRFSIPGEISFAGYDGIPMMQAISPRLTTVRQQCDSIGEEAAKRLIGLIENPGVGSWLPTVVPIEFLSGGTVGKMG